MLIVVGLYVRVWDLWNFYWSPDEALVLLISSAPTIPAVLDAAAAHPHPPMRYLVLRFMMYASQNMVFLKGIAYLPGVALIPLFFLIGRRTAGAASGIAMASIAAFSYAGILLSEVLRTYMLGAFFVSGGLYAFFTYLQVHRGRYIALYSAAMTLGLLSHYFTILPVVAVCLVWLFRVVRSVRPLSEAIRAALAHLPVAVVALSSFVFHLSNRYSEAHWNSITGGWLAPHFPETSVGFLMNAFRLFAYFYLLPNAWWMMVLAGVGVAVLWGTKRREVAAVIVLTFTINIALTIAHQYPFGGTRQCFYLLPLVSVAVGATVQFGWNRALIYFDRLAGPGVLQWVSTHRKTISYVALGCFVAILSLVSYGINGSENLRRYDRNGWVELPVKREDVTRALRYVHENRDAADVVLAARQSIVYVRLAARKDAIPVFSAAPDISFNDIGPIVPGKFWSFHSEEVLWRAFKDLVQHSRIREDTTIWVVSIGWQPIKRVLGRGICGPPMVSAWNHGGAGVYGFRGSAVAQRIERRLANEIPE
jgi:hypothetical protein